MVNMCLNKQTIIDHAVNLFNSKIKTTHDYIDESRKVYLNNVTTTFRDVLIDKIDKIYTDELIQTLGDDSLKFEVSLSYRYDTMSSLTIIWESIEDILDTMVAIEMGKYFYPKYWIFASYENTDDAIDDEFRYWSEEETPNDIERIRKYIVDTFTKLN